MEFEDMVLKALKEIEENKKEEDRNYSADLIAYTCKIRSTEYTGEYIDYDELKKDSKKFIEACETLAKFKHLYW